MGNIRIFLGSIAGGIVVTLVTGLIPTTPSGLVGASWYGLPATWLVKRVLAPQYNPWYPNYVGFGMDVIFWFVVIGIVWLIADHFSKGKKPARRQTRRRR